MQHVGRIGDCQPPLESITVLQMGLQRPRTPRSLSALPTQREGPAEGPACRSAHLLQTQNTDAEFSRASRPGLSGSGRCKPCASAARRQHGWREYEHLEGDLTAWKGFRLGPARQRAGERAWQAGAAYPACDTCPHTPCSATHAMDCKPHWCGDSSARANAIRKAVGSQEEVQNQWHARGAVGHMCTKAANAHQSQPRAV